MKNCLPRNSSFSRAGLAFAEYLADGDAAEERADDVLDMDELRPNGADCDHEQLVRSSSYGPLTY